MDLFDNQAVSQFGELGNVAEFERVELRPGDVLSIPSEWLHEVHTQADSISLGWRYCLTTKEQTLSAKLEQQAIRFQKGEDPMGLLHEAMEDPELMNYLKQHGGF